MNEIHFLRPYFLLLIIPALILAFLLLRYRKAIGPWQNICSKDLLPYVMVSKGKRNYFSYLLTALTLILLITAMSGPAWQQISQPLIKQKSGLVIALDLSPAMDAQDIKPSRLQRAIYKIDDLLEMHQEGQVALIAFSGHPFVVTPLTDDIATIKNLLPVLETKMMPASGHRANLAIVKAIDLLKQSGINQGSILLITSELSNQELDASIAIAKKENVTVSILGIGTDDTALIPQAGGGFVKNSDGALVIAKLSKNNLTQLAASTGGVFAVITVDDQDLRQLASRNKGFVSHEETEIKKNQWHDQGYLLVLLTLPFASLIFRRGILLMILFLTPYTLQAISYDDLWKTKDQQAQELFQQEKYAEAKDLFLNKEWQGICSYKLGDYEHAAQLFQDIPTAEGLYNYGTAKAKAGDLEGALEAYNNALELQPDHEDTLYNKKAIEEFLKQNENQDQNQKNKKDKNKSKSDKKTSKKEPQDQKQQQDNDKEQNQDKQEESGKEQDQNQSEQQDEEKGNEQGQSQKDQNEAGEDRDQQNSPNDQSSEEQNKPSDDEKPNMDELSDQYRENIEKEMKKGHNQLDEKKEAQKKPKELSAEGDNDPQRRIDERWLQRIQDDPAGLLRRKFQQQYRQQQKTK